MTLNDFLITEIFTFMLVFCRVGTAMMLLPGIGESYISGRVRLLLAVMLSFVLAPVLKNIPLPPDTLGLLVKMLFAEILIGLFLGTATRLLLATINTAGMIIAFQSSLASAVTPDVAGTGGQGSSLGNLLSLTALVLIFVLDLHHLMLQALYNSYTLFSAGVFPLMDDITEHITKTVSASFTMAVQLAAPHIVLGLVVYLAAGIVARLVPSFQVFFLMMAPNLALSFFLLMLAFSSIMLYYMDYFRESLSYFAGD